MRTFVSSVAVATALSAAPAFAQAPAAEVPPPAPAPAAPAATPTSPAATTVSPGEGAATVPVASDPASPAPAPLPGVTTPTIEAAPATEPSRAPAAEPSAVAEPALPGKLAVGKKGFWQPGAQLQFWAYAQTQEVNEEQDITSYFRLRRAELRVKGEIVPGLFSYNVMIDPARALEFDSRRVAVAPTDPEEPSAGSVTVSQPNGATTILQDVILTLTSDYADVSFGQFKLPLSYEAYNSTAKLLLPEFALSTRYFSARRDVGIKVDKKLGKHFYYRVDVLNGSGQNRLDNDDQKDGAVRLEAYPIDGVTVGAVGYLGLNRRDVSATKDRVEADLKIDLAGAVLQAEYIHGWDGATGDESPDRAEAHGFYATAGYSFGGKLQPVVRIGHLDPRLGATSATITAANDSVWSYEAGANYFIEGNDLELQLALGTFDYEHVNNVSFGIFEVQVAF